MQHPPLDSWSPMSIEEVQSVFADSPFRWWICGGRALELFVGRSWREHADTDVGIKRDQLDLLTDRLEEWDLWLASKGVLTRWDGRPLSPADDENNLWLRPPDGNAWALDLTINSGNDQGWIYRRNEELRRPWDEAILESDDGIPYLAPELQLLFKSKNPRPKDYQDAEQVLPRLSPERMEFLRRALPEGHPWR